MPEMLQLRKEYLVSNEYISWILRYVPNTARGEFINIGVLVGSHGSDWAIRHVSNFSRASRLGGDAAFMRPLLRELMRRVALSNEEPDGSETDLFNVGSPRPLTFWTVEELSARLNNSLQISDPTPAFGSSASEVADILYGHLVSETVRASVPRARTLMRNTFRNAVMNAWHHDAEIPLAVGPVIEIGHLHQDFDFAILDGEVEQMTQVISLNRQDRALVRKDIAAWNYAVTRLRRDGAVLRSQDLDVPSDTPIIIIHDQPTNEEQHDILKFAREGWRDLDVEAYPSDDIDRAASRAISLAG